MTLIRTAVVGVFCWICSASFGLAQSNECISPEGYPDKDVQRNLPAILSNDRLCLSDIEFRENGLNWKLVIIENQKHPNGPTIYVLHDNENESFDAAVYAINKYGGKIVAVEGKEQRNFAGVQDPNRNFGITPEETRTCRDMKTKPAPIFTQLLLDLRNTRSNFFFTMHNNANGHSGNGGRGAISVYRKSSVLHGMPAPNGGDEDDVMLLASTKPPGQDKKLNKAIEYFHKSGVHVVYEHVQPAKNDCSFSNFVVLNDLGAYYNIETQHGHVEEQIRILDILMKYQRVRARG